MMHWCCARTHLSALQRFRSYCLFPCLRHLWKMDHVNSSWCCVEWLTKSVGKSAAEISFVILTVATGVRLAWTTRTSSENLSGREDLKCLLRKTNQSLKWQPGEEAKAGILWCLIVGDTAADWTSHLCLLYFDIWMIVSTTGLCVFWTGFLKRYLEV